MSTSPPQAPMDHLRASVRRLREERGWSQRDLARQAALAGYGITSVTVSALESGKTPSPGLETLLAIASALGVSVGHLLGEETGVPERLQPLVSVARELSDEDLELLGSTARRLADAESIELRSVAEAEAPYGADDGGSGDEGVGETG